MTVKTAVTDRTRLDSMQSWNTFDCLSDATLPRHFYLTERITSESPLLTRIHFACVRPERASLKLYFWWWCLQAVVIGYICERHQLSFIVANSHRYKQKSEGNQSTMPRILSRSLLYSRRHTSSSKRVGGSKQQNADSSLSRRKPTSPLRRNVTKHSMMDGIPRVPSDNWGQFVEIASPHASFSDFERLMVSPPSSNSTSGTSSPTRRESEGWRSLFQ
jgi:hypothetical protein